MGELVIGKYELVRRLAVGGMGEVFLYKQVGVPGFERLVILKSLLPDLAEEPGLIDQFLDEARVAATLNHPNIVSIYEVGLWNGTYFIAMEHIHGVDLARLIVSAIKSQQRIPAQVAATIIRDAALGLDHAHRARDAAGNPLGVVHRDISPQNIMVRGDGVTKVVDFGIAKAANRSSRTETGTIKGKLSYMAPEQIQGKALDGRCDQFALGVVLWELCASRRLFKSDTDVDVVEKIIRQPIPRLSSVLAECPPLMDDVVARMLERDPADRFPSCGEVAEALTHHLESAAHHGQHADVPACMHALVGPELNPLHLTPHPQNYVVSLSPVPPMTLSGVPTVRAPSRDDVRTVPRPPPVPARRVSTRVMALAAALVALAATGFGVFHLSRDPLPVPRLEITQPEGLGDARAELVDAMDAFARLDMDRAVGQLASLALQRRDQPDLLYYQAWALSLGDVDIDDADSVVGVIARARAAPQTPVRVLVLKGLQSFWASEFPAAQAALEEARALQPDNYEVNWALAEALWFGGLQPESCVVYKRVFAQAPGFLPPTWMASHCSLSTGDDAYTQALANALDREPKGHDRAVSLRIHLDVANGRVSDSTETAGPESLAARIGALEVAGDWARAGKLASSQLISARPGRAAAPEALTMAGVAFGAGRESEWQQWLQVALTQAADGASSVRTAAYSDVAYAEVMAGRGVQAAAAASLARGSSVEASAIRNVGLAAALVAFQLKDPALLPPSLEMAPASLLAVVDAVRLALAGDPDRAADAVERALLLTRNPKYLIPTAWLGATLARDPVRRQKFCGWLVRPRKVTPIWPFARSLCLTP